jgi:hypothetical protein
MIVYNIPCKVDPAIAKNWLIWQLEEHIPEVMATRLFDDFKVHRLLEQNDEDGPTYTIQYFTNSMDRYQQYIKNHAPLLREKAFAKWGNQFIGFRSVMEAVQ